MSPALTSLTFLPLTLRPALAPPPPRPAAPAEQLRSYLRQLRETLAPRLVERVYAPGGPGAKFWLAFGKRRFMGRELPVA